MDVEAEGSHEGRPYGKRKRGRLDVEAEEVTEEVQTGRENEADWTLKQSKSRKKSKREEKTRWIGR